jgi:hypothetical protein
MVNNKIFFIKIGSKLIQTILALFYPSISPVVIFALLKDSFLSKSHPGWEFRFHRKGEWKV